MSGHTFTLNHATARERALRAVMQAPDGYVVKVSEPKRSLDQNSKMWAMLTDVSICKPDGRTATPHTWKEVLMNGYGFACQFEMGLDGRPFPTGLSTSKLGKREMSDFIEFIYAYGSEKGVKWSENYEVDGRPTFNKDAA